ncbi:hypothetical protein F5Y05DRAFT_414182 [Hypoxylon sp. FL0543]|nr:hypothetical protein F5Y05DRAFT_414182 [Hypoxylon sp. FL0543]
MALWAQRLSRRGQCPLRMGQLPSRLVSSRPAGVDFPPPPAAEEDGRPTMGYRCNGMGRRSSPPSSTETTRLTPSPFNKGRHPPGLRPPGQVDTTGCPTAAVPLGLARRHETRYIKTSLLLSLRFSPRRSRDLLVAVGRRLRYASGASTKGVD